MPPEQEPGLEYTRRVVPSKQFAAGGELHVTLAQGSGLQVAEAASHPKGQGVSVVE
jgi:hypothetical protein